MTFRHILRRLLRVPMFTTVAVATLAIGIGANAAIFSVVHGVLLKPLPYPHPDELVAVDHVARGVGMDHAGAAPFLFFTYREENRTFQDIGLWRTDTVSVTGRAEPEQVVSLDVTDGVLPILEVKPIVGRTFSRQDDTPGSPETVMLTFGYWRAKFGGEASVIGQRVLVDGRAREIIGVLPATFRFLDRKPALLVPLQLDRNRTFLGNFSYAALARLKPGVTIQEASADVARMIPIGLQRFPPFPGYNAKMFQEARLAPLLQSLKQSLVGDLGRVLWVLMGTIAIVLLIACANVANLLLVRAEGRQQELAIRAALGAGWGRIARELIAESVVLGALGGALGLSVAFAALRFLPSVAPASLPRIDDVSVDGPVLLFTLAISVVAGLLFGTIPVIKHAGPHLGMALRAGGRTASSSRERHRARSTLVVVQVALALVLLIGSALMIRTFLALKHVDPGFIAPESLLTVRISIPETLVEDQVRLVHAQQEILDKIAAIPGVSAAALSSTIPMTGDGWQDPIFAQDRIYAESQVPPVRRFTFVSPGLLKTMGNRLIAGRDFTWTDVYDMRPVAMVSENLARELWHEPAAAIGKRIRESLKTPWREVVGVVADERDNGVDQPAPATAYWPILMDEFEGDRPFTRRTLAYVIRSDRAGASGLLNEVSRAVWSVNPNLPLANVRTMREVYDASLARTSFTLLMLAVAGVMALLLGIAGIYGVIAYSVSQRTREIGIRMALGARGAEVTRLFVWHGLRLAGVGVACGLIAAVALVRLMASLLFGVSANDPSTYVAVSLGLTAAAVLASYLPALRATQVDPVETLRAE